jgi:hypothetical protein
MGGRTTVLPAADGIVSVGTVCMSERAVGLMTLGGVDGVCAADLPGSEEGIQIRVETPLPRIEKEQVLDDGGIIGTDTVQFWSP